MASFVTAAPIGDHEVTLMGGNGLGAVNTAIRRYTTTVRNVGSAITYADSANNGASFTINQAGLYELYMEDGVTVTNWMGASVNSAQLTTNVESITSANRLMVTNVGANWNMAVSKIVRLAAGDVVRPHVVPGAAWVGSNDARFTIRKVGT